MDFKALRDKILPNIELYNKDEVKVVVAKLLDFLIDIDDKNQFLEKEIKKLKEDEKKDKLETNIIKEEVNTDEISTEKEKLLAQAKSEAQIVHDKIVQEAIERVSNLIDKVKQKDEENKMYRKHILSIFRRSFFRFSNTNYYILKTEDEEFKQLISFFQVDEELQKLCDDNIKKLMQDEKYQETVNKVASKEVEDFFEEEQEIEIKEIDVNELEDISIDEIEEELTNDTKESKAKFLDVLNQYKNK